MNIMDMFCIQIQVVLIPLVWADATMQIELVSFANPDHRELDGDCCDILVGSCSNNACDNRFYICLDDLQTR